MQPNDEVVANLERNRLLLIRNTVRPDDFRVVRYLIRVILPVLFRASLHSLSRVVWQLMRGCRYLVAGLRAAGFTGGWLSSSGLRV